MNRISIFCHKEGLMIVAILDCIDLFFRRTAFMYRNIRKCQNFTFKSYGFFLEDNGL